MKDAHSNWEALPVEILHKTFSLILGKKSIEIALVCKNWTQPAQAVLYNEVTVSTLSQLKAFQNTVENSPTFGKLVKIFTCMVYSYRATCGTERDGILTTLLSTHLPNVERYTNKYQHSYIPELNALLDSHLTRLKNLKHPNTNTDKCEIANYTTCALLMRTRLDKLRIDDKYEAITDAKQAKAYFNLLYNKLHEFDKLRSIVIKKDTNEEIEVLEYIVESCKTLERIEFGFYSPNPPPQNTTTSIAKSKLAPNFNIISIDASVNTWSFVKVFSYINDKFPKLQHIAFYMYSSGSTVLGQHTINSMFKYMSKLSNFSAHGVPVEPTTVWDAIGEYWIASEKIGSKKITIYYNDNPSARQQCLFSVIKRENLIDTSVYPGYPGWKHINFIENYGKYLRSLEFGFSVEIEYLATDLHELPQNFITHLMKHCPYLETLSIQGSILKRLSYFEMDLHEKFSSLSELILRYSMIYAGVLEPLSLMLPKLKSLCLGFGLKYCPVGEDIFTTPNILDSRKIEIVMPHTTIDEVVIEVNSEDPIYIKLYSIADKKYHCYLADLEVDAECLMKSIDEEEFSLGNENQLVYYICCQNNPRFFFDQ